jgi:hypothetical protein
MESVVIFFSAAPKRSESAFDIGATRVHDPQHLIGDKFIREQRGTGACMHKGAGDKKCCVEKMRAQEVPTTRAGCLRNRTRQAEAEKNKSKLLLLGLFVIIPSVRHASGLSPLSPDRTKTFLARRDTLFIYAYRQAGECYIWLCVVQSRF